MTTLAAATEAVRVAVRTASGLADAKVVLANQWLPGVPRPAPPYATVLLAASTPTQRQPDEPVKVSGAAWVRGIVESSECLWTVQCFGSGAVQRAADIRRALLAVRGSVFGGALASGVGIRSVSAVTDVSRLLDTAREEQAQIEVTALVTQETTPVAAPVVGSINATVTLERGDPPVTIDTITLTVPEAP